MQITGKEQIWSAFRNAPLTARLVRQLVRASLLSCLPSWDISTSERPVTWALFTNECQCPNLQQTWTRCDACRKASTFHGGGGYIIFRHGNALTWSQDGDIQAKVGEQGKSIICGGCADSDSPRDMRRGDGACIFMVVSSCNNAGDALFNGIGHLLDTHKHMQCAISWERGYTLQCQGPDFQLIAKQQEWQRVASWGGLGLWPGLGWWQE